MKRALLAAVLMTALVGGVSIADAAPGGGGFVRPAPAGSDPAKELARVQPDDSGFAESVGEPGSNVPQGTAGGYVYVPVEPYRTIDTRDYTDGYTGPGDVWHFDVLTDSAGNVRLPAEAVAVTYNLTATNTSGGGGYLTVFPGNITTVPFVSSVNWSLNGTTIANGGTVGIGNYTSTTGQVFPGQVKVGLGPPDGRVGGADFIMDITGYYI